VYILPPLLRGPLTRGVCVLKIAFGNFCFLNNPINLSVVNNIEYGGGVVRVITIEII
jgi:hypothetical protein